MPSESSILKLLGILNFSQVPFEVNIFLELTFFEKMRVIIALCLYKEEIITNTSTELFLSRTILLQIMHKKADQKFNQLGPSAMA